MCKILSASLVYLEAPAATLLQGWILLAGYGKVEKRVRTTGGGATGSVRNLRIREDTAKYLLNLVSTLRNMTRRREVWWIQDRYQMLHLR